MPHTEAEIEQMMEVYEELKIQIAEVKMNHTKMTKEQRKVRNSLYARIRYHSHPEVRAKHREYYLKQNPDAIQYKKDVKRTRINNSKTIKKQIQTEIIEEFKTTVRDDKPQMVHFGF